MKQIIKKVLGKIGRNLAFSEKESLNSMLLLAGKQRATTHNSYESIKELSSVEFKVFSQNGEDGIIDWLVSKLPMIPKSFIEFGVENYQESNTRFLLINKYWKGLVIDGDPANVQVIRQDSIYWQYNLKAVCSFITKDNINDIFKEAGFTGEIGILSIDIDGNDYWVWQAINTVNPAIIIAEYSSVLGDVYPVSIPYEANFYRHKAHYSGQYAGASIAALKHLAQEKGYVFIGTNAVGVNAFFVRQDLYPIVSNAIETITSYPVSSSDTRNELGELTFIRGRERLELIQNLPVVNVETGETFSLSVLIGVYSQEWLDLM